MSLDRSLKSTGGLAQHRSVFTRAERIAKMRETGTFPEDRSPLKLPKMVSKRISTGKKKKAKAEGEAAAAAGGAAGAAAPAGGSAAATPAAGAAPAKAAAPAKGAAAAPVAGKKK